jgi:hypothetical protein
MRTRTLPVWIGVLVAFFSGQLALAVEARPNAKPARAQETGNVAAATADADRISSSHATTSGSGLLTPVPEGQAASVGSDSCATAEPIVGTGVFNFDNTAATLDGLPHAACTVFNQSQIEQDVWFCWTAPAEVCAGSYSISTCGRTAVDTRIAVYSGCGCPTDDSTLLNCRDDECDLQTRLSFNPVPSQQYLIRLGRFPGPTGGTGGLGNFLITCDLNPPCDEPLSHCQSQDRSDALNSNRTGFVTADGFTPTLSGDINGVCWWGAYLTNANPPQDCEATSTDTFRIRYFTDAGGLPGSEIASFSQLAATLTVEPPFSTGLRINGVAPEYEFHAIHANVPVVGGDCYWIEITNELTGCTWFWEMGLSGDGRAVQDGTLGVPPNGYGLSDVIVGDMAFCVNTAIVQDGADCLPPPPPNDLCANASSIIGPGTFVVDTAAATTNGPNHAACLATGQTGIDRDAWFLWTSTCSGDVVVRTCDTTTVDSKVAVYSGTTCPTAADNPVACNDDLCGPVGYQSMLVFPATVSQQFLIRVGSYPAFPGGVIGLAISCGPPNNAACGPGSGNPSCCIGSATNPATGGCGDESCCELVCACDPYCCNVEWDADCAAHGLGNSGCGAADLCGCSAICGNPAGGDCCSGHAPPGGCSDQACCEAVCACDSFCCNTEWDANCAGNGFVPGCGALALCSSLCTPPPPPCPSGTITFVNPPHLAVDARRPHPPGNPNLREGFKVFTVTGPPGAQSSCWTVQETATFGSPNTISSVVENPLAPGTYTVTLFRAITAGAGSSITYTPTAGAVSQGCFKSHPANVNSDTGAAPVDILHLIDNLNGIRVPPLASWQCDLDRSNVCLPADIIAEIDMLNGVNGFIVWNGTSRPTGPPGCP